MAGTLLNFPYSIEVTAPNFIHLASSLRAEYAYVPPDKRYAATPDDATFRYLALSYTKVHQKMHSSSEFPNGITNGANVSVSQFCMNQQ